MWRLRWWRLKARPLYGRWAAVPRCKFAAAARRLDGGELHARRCDDDLAALAIKVADFSYAKGHDEKHGGIVAFVDENGEQPPGPEHIQFGADPEDCLG